jgi:hypothetical protein
MASDLTRELYVESLEESLAAVREYMAKDTSAPPATPPAITDQVTLLRNDLDSQRKQFELVMEQNSKLLAALSKGGGGGSSGGSSGKGGGGKTAHREKNSAPTATKWWCITPRTVTPWRPTRTNAPRDGRASLRFDRDRGHSPIAM